MLEENSLAAFKTLSICHQRVAVKMLKPQHSSGELQDLITEYTRLKEVAVIIFLIFFCIFFYIFSHIFFVTEYTRLKEVITEYTRLKEVAAGWQKLHGSTGGTRRKVWTLTKILSPNIRYFAPN